MFSRFYQLKDIQVLYNLSETIIQKTVLILCGHGPTPTQYKYFLVPDIHMIDVAFFEQEFAQLINVLMYVKQLVPFV